MKLYLVQHGIALKEDVDPKKSLSREGKIQTLRVLAFLGAKGLNVDVLWHSNKQRAIDTARVITENIKVAEVSERSDLSPLSEVGDLPAQIVNLNKNLMIVSHLPFLNKLLSKLILGVDTYELVLFKNSCIVCLDYKDRWRIEWVVCPDII
mgnify:CR=1 FL=1